MGCTCVQLGCDWAATGDRGDLCGPGCPVGPLGPVVPGNPGDQGGPGGPGDPDGQCGQGGLGSPCGQGPGQVGLGG